MRSVHLGRGGRGCAGARLGVAEWLRGATRGRSAGNAGCRPPPAGRLSRRGQSSTGQRYRTSRRLEAKARRSERVKLLQRRRARGTDRGRRRRTKGPGGRDGLQRKQFRVGALVMGHEMPAARSSPELALSRIVCVLGAASVASGRQAAGRSGGSVWSRSCGGRRTECVRVLAGLFDVGRMRWRRMTGAERERQI